MINVKLFKKIAIVLFFISFATPSFSLMVELPLKQLVVSSKNIIIGNVSSVKSEWNTDRNMIYTIVRVMMIEIIKGDENPKTILIKVPGGKVGNVGCKVSDTPEFKINERILVFLNPVNSKKSSIETIQNSHLNSYEIFGKSQGKFVLDNEGKAARGNFTLYPDKLIKSQDFQENILVQRIQDITSQEAENG